MRHSFARLPTHHVRRAMVATVCVAGIAVSAQTRPADAAREENPVAVFAALDKVTARISRLEVQVNDTVTFGALKITPRICNSRPPTEPPKTTSFVEVNEIQLDESERRIFTGWMFAESPGLHAVQHPVFDVWLTGCANALSLVVADRPATTITDLLTQDTGMPLPVRKPQREEPAPITRRRRTIR